MLTLTGPPRLNGLVLPYASKSRALDVEWSGEHVDERLRGGIVRRLETRWRGRVSLGWSALDPALAEAILQELRRAPEFDLVTRTKQAGDPDWAEEVVLRCRLSSPTPGATSPASRVTSVMIEAETVGTYPSLPGVLDGALVRTQVTAETVRAQATGDATFRRGTRTVTTPLGRPVTLATATPYPPPLAALRLRQSGPRRARITLDLPTP